MMILMQTFRMTMMSMMAMMIMMMMTLTTVMMMMMSMQAAWWVEYVCRHGTANWLKSIGEEVFNSMLIMMLIIVMRMVAIGSKKTCRQCGNYQTVWSCTLAPWLARDNDF